MISKKTISFNNKLENILINENFVIFHASSEVWEAIDKVWNFENNEPTLKSDYRI